MQRKTIIELSVPHHTAEVAVFGCIDARLELAYRYLLESHLRLKPGQYYFHRTPGALTGFFNEKEAIKQDWYGTTKLLFDKDVKKIIIAPHTQCAADATTCSFEHSDQDFEHQLQKISKCRDILGRYAEQHRVSLPIYSYVIDIQGKGIKVVHLDDVAAAVGAGV